MPSNTETMYILGAVLLLICASLVSVVDSSTEKKTKDASPYIINLSAAAIMDGKKVASLSGESMFCENSPLWRLNTAVAMTENYFRGKFRRESEIWYARLKFKVTDKIPNLSMGLTQIQPSSARLAVAELGIGELSEHQLFELMSKDETSLILSYGYLMYLKRTMGIEILDLQAVEIISQRYNGITKTIQSELYSLMVKNIYESIQSLEHQKANKCMQLTVIPLRFASLHNGN